MLCAENMRTRLSPPFKRREMKESDLEDTSTNHLRSATPYNFDSFCLQMSSQVETRADSQYPHTAEVGEIHKIKNCI